jgi:alkylation response protein AidB-like acyl-CoA dehydrogenase
VVNPLGDVQTTATRRPSDDELEAFRAHVRKVIAGHAPSIVAREGHRAPAGEDEERQLRAWFKAMYDHGLLGADWPVEYGGDPDHHPRHGPLVLEEVLLARAPRPVDQTGLATQVTLRFGSDEQKRFHLPRIRSGESVWCQLLSEPDAGSDLANVRCRATERPDGTFVVNGQKTWITDAHWADWGLGLFRTDPESARHQGLTMFYVPMDAPGIEVRPIPTMNGAPEVNEVFFDDVVLGPEHVVDRVGAGWHVIMAGLDVERFGIGGNVVLLEMLYDDLVTLVSHLTVDGVRAVERDDVRQAVADFGVEATVARQVVDDQIDRALDGRDEIGGAAITKIGFAETYNSMSRYGTRLAAEGVVDPGGEAALGRLQDAWLWSRAYTISGGSSEMMRNILAKRRLGLPAP